MSYKKHPETPPDALEAWRRRKATELQNIDDLSVVDFKPVDLRIGHVKSVHPDARTADQLRKTEDDIKTSFRGASSQKRAAELRSSILGPETGE